MKKIIFPLALVILMAIGCKNEKPAEFTFLGLYTPYENYVERLNGKVEKVIEKHYWAKLEGKSYIKVNPVTDKNSDSLKWRTSDIEATFDKAGDLMICAYLDDNYKAPWKIELTKENNILALAKGISNDTLQWYHKLKCDQNGIINEIEGYMPVVDTLMFKRTIKVSTKEDTIVHQVYNYKGIPVMRWLNLIDDKKQFLSVGEFDKEGVYHIYMEMKYNEKGKMSELTSYDKDKKDIVINYSNYEYDHNGNWTKVIAKDDKGNVVMVERTYTYFE